ncbi:MAG: hypothetical protein D6743_08710 [Calditrichaeota bacterium]|nr:MAG: hypothetical protein D6743_08710 [Calditrichota bacterium]
MISIQDTVFLRWDTIELDDLLGYRLYRKSNLEPEFILLAEIPPDENTYADFDVDFGVEYAYQLSAAVPGHESARTDALPITPGPSFTWFADEAGDRVVKLTHDTRYTIHTTSGFFGLVDIAADPCAGVAWVVNRNSIISGDVLRIDASGRVVLPRVNFTTPVEIALDLNSGAAWVADRGAGEVVKLNSSANRLFSVQGLGEPVSVSVDQTTGDCLVADRRGDRVTAISADGSATRDFAGPLNALRALRVNSTESSVWVSDSTRVMKFTLAGVAVLTLPQEFNFANTLAVNEGTGDIWVSDLSRGTVSKFSTSGAKEFEVTGFNNPVDLAVNLFDGSCIVADRLNNRLVRIAADGSIERTLDGAGFPFAVAVQNSCPE